MIKWQGYCSSQNTWELKAHLPPELIKAFENPDPDPVHVDKARERIGLIFERGIKVESVEIRHDMVRFLFPNIPVELQAAATDICDQELDNTGLAPYVEWTINANGSQCCIVKLTFCLLLLQIFSELPLRKRQKHLL